MAHHPAMTARGHKHQANNSMDRHHERPLPYDPLEAATQLRNEIHSLIRRYGQESDVSVYTAIGALRMVEHDLVTMLDTK